jgi:hypothetical protein
MRSEIGPQGQEASAMTPKIEEKTYEASGIAAHGSRVVQVETDDGVVALD